MNKKRIINILVAATVSVMTFATTAFAQDETCYTYTYDIYKQVRESPNAYVPVDYILGNELEIGDFEKPQGMFVRDEIIYLVDTNNNRIVEIDYSTGEAEVLRVITEFTESSDADEAVEETVEDGATTEETVEADTTAEETVEADTTAEETVEADTTAEETVEADTTAEETVEADTTAEETVEADTTAEETDSFYTFNQPTDVFVDTNGDLYIADMMNNRVLHLNKDLQLIKILLKPDSETITAESDFLPRKVSVDRSGRVVLLAKGYNEGFLQFSSSGEFTGYVGANKVQYNPIDYFWRTIASDEQRAQMATFVPTEYNNMYIDNDSFIYCTTADFNSDQLLYGGTTPIRRINSLGADVLIRNGMTTPIGDISWSDTETIYGPSVLMDIAVLENETYFVLDRNRGRIFSYDSQGNMLYAFGGLGNKEGYFRYPSALELIGTDLLVCDEKTGAITVFKLTEFGSLINNALDEYNEGHYQESADYWKEVLALNGNYDLAYKGIGRALMLQGDYSEAMVYFKEKLYDKEYSQAYEMYRREWIEENIAIIVTIIGVLVASFIAFKVYKRIKKGVSYDDFN